MRLRILLIALGLFAAAALGVWSLLFSLESKDTFSLTVFDVGQGDAIFIETPDRYQALVDGGGDARILQKLGSLMPFWDRTIDLVILTHPHADHVGGLPDVLRRYKIGAIIESNSNYGTAEYAAWQKLKTEKEIESRAAIAGMRVFLGQSALIRILAPFEYMNGRTVKNPHDANVVALVSFGETEFLLMGDAEDDTERELLARGAITHTEVLKVGHHGSRTSSLAPFLAAVAPAVSIISVGQKNRYGHPHQEVLERLADFSGRVFRTDRDGDVRISSDGRSVEAKSSR